MDVGAVGEVEPNGSVAWPSKQNAAKPLVCKAQTALTPVRCGFNLWKTAKDHVTSHQFNCGHFGRACRRRGGLSGSLRQDSRAHQAARHEHTAKVTQPNWPTPRPNSPKTQATWRRRSRSWPTPSRTRQGRGPRRRADQARRRTFRQARQGHVSERDDAQNQLAAYKATGFDAGSGHQAEQNLSRMRSARLKRQRRKSCVLHTRAT
jgi:hypothetical protein